jgi:hypothetical protein
MTLHGSFIGAVEWAFLATISSDNRQKIDWRKDKACLSEIRIVRQPKLGNDMLNIGRRDEHTMDSTQMLSKVI